MKTTEFRLTDDLSYSCLLFFLRFWHRLPMLILHPSQILVMSSVLWHMQLKADVTSALIAAMMMASSAANSLVPCTVDFMSLLGEQPVNET